MPCCSWQSVSRIWRDRNLSKEVVESSTRAEVLIATINMWATFIA